MTDSYALKRAIDRPMHRFRDLCKEPTSGVTSLPSYKIITYQIYASYDEANGFSVELSARGAFGQQGYVCLRHIQVFLERQVFFLPTGGCMLRQ